MRLNLGWTKVEVIHGASSEGGENWSDSGCILKVEPTDSRQIAYGCERIRGDKDDTKVFGLNKWKDGVAINDDIFF